MPTRKWWAASIGEATTAATAIILSAPPGITKGEWVVIIGLASTRVIAWITNNEKGKAGVKGQTGQP